MGQAPVDLVEQLNAAVPPAYEMGQPFGPTLGGITASLIEAFQSASAEQRQIGRAALSRTARVFLLNYAWERAEQAIRQKSGDMVTQGLSSLSIEDGGFDFRDSLVRMAILFRSAQKLGLDPTQVFAQAAGFATSLSAELRNFPARLPRDRDLRAFWTRERTTADGFGYELQISQFAKAVRRKVWRIKLRRFFGLKG